MTYFRSLLRNVSAAVAGDADIDTLQPCFLYLCLATAAFLFFYLHLFHLPNVPVFHSGDQYIYMEHAERMMRGDVLYRDLFQFNSPGTESLYYVLFRCFGIQLWLVHLTLCLTLVGITLLVYALSRTILAGSTAFLPALVFLVVCQRTSLDGAHHWYSTLLVLLAVNLVARARNLVGIATAGVCLGLACVFTSTRGASVAMGIALFFLWKHHNLRTAAKPITVLFAPAAFVFTFVLAGYAHAAGVRRLYESLIVFPLHFYPAGAANGPSVYFDEWTAILPLSPRSLLYFALWLALNVAVPLTFIAFAMYYSSLNAIERRSDRQKENLVLCAFAGGFALLAVASAPSAPRMNCAAAFAYILLTAMVCRNVRHRSIKAALAVVFCIGAAELAAAVARPVYVLHGPRGLIAYLHRSDFEWSSFIAERALPGDRLFGDTQLNVLLGLPNPTAVPWVEPNGYTRPEQVADVVRALSNKPTQFVIWSDDMDQYSGPDDNLQPLRVYLKSHYHPMQKSGYGSAVLIPTPQPFPR